MGNGPGLNDIERKLEAKFPGLHATDYSVSSPVDTRYNCIAFAAGDETNWWWPDAAKRATYWPHGIATEETLPAFVSAYATVGFSECASDKLEHGFEKVALYADAGGTPTHASRQLATGRWISKLGKYVDIEHSLHALEGDEYGLVVRILRRRRGETG